MTEQAPDNKTVDVSDWAERKAAQRVNREADVKARTAARDDTVELDADTTEAKATHNSRRRRRRTTGRRTPLRRCRCRT